MHLGGWLYMINVTIDLSWTSQKSYCFGRRFDIWLLDLKMSRFENLKISAITGFSNHLITTFSNYNITEAHTA